MTSEPQDGPRESPRLIRAASLGRELVSTMTRLAVETTSSDAVVLLELVARCAGFTDDELAGGAGDAVAKACELVAADARFSEIAASGLNVDGVVERAWRVADGGSSEPDIASLAIEALRIAAVAEALPERHRARVVAACELLCAIIGGHPAAFQQMAQVALDRVRNERPSRLPAVARDMVMAMRELPQLAIDDQQAEREELPVEIAAQLEQAVRSLDERSWYERLMVGSKAWLDRIREMCAAARAAPMQPAGLQADAGDPTLDHVVLCRTHGGVLFLVQRGTSLWLEWQGDGEPPTLARKQDAHWIVLVARPMKDALHWQLDPPAEGAQVELRFGPDLVHIELPR